MSRLLLCAATLALTACETVPTSYAPAAYYPPPPAPYTNPNLFGLTGASAAVADGGRGMAQIQPTPPVYMCSGSVTVTCYPF